MCRCFVIGCYNLHRKVDYEKEGLSPPPERVPCSTCRMPMPTEYYRTVTCCCICFIPLCPLEYSRPYLICKGCGMQINNINRTPCRSCNVAVPHGYRFCPECGSEVK